LAFGDDNLPSDLAVLPTMPYSERPSELPLDIEECRTAIWLSAGNITEAAKVLKVTSIRLRNFVKKSPYLTSEIQEAADRLVDLAEANVLDALIDTEDASRRDTMSRFVLTNIGKSKGWGTGVSGHSLSVKNSSGGTIIVQWADGTQLNSNDSNVIEGEVVDERDEGNETKVA
jgi:hypothetical protein